MGWGDGPAAETKCFFACLQEGQCARGIHYQDDRKGQCARRHLPLKYEPVQALCGSLSSLASCCLQVKLQHRANPVFEEMVELIVDGDTAQRSNTLIHIEIVTEHLVRHPSFQVGLAMCCGC